MQELNDLDVEDFEDTPFKDKGRQSGVFGRESSQKYLPPIAPVAPEAPSVGTAVGNADATCAHRTDGGAAVGGGAVLFPAEAKGAPDIAEMWISDGTSGAAAKDEKGDFDAKDAMNRAGSSSPTDPTGVPSGGPPPALSPDRRSSASTMTTHRRLRVRSLRRAGGPALTCEIGLRSAAAANAAALRRGAHVFLLEEGETVEGCKRARVVVATPPGEGAVEMHGWISMHQLAEVGGHGEVMVRSW